MSSPLSPINLEGERGEGRRNSTIFQSSLLCHGLRVILRLQLCPEFIFQLNYENDVKITKI